MNIFNLGVAVFGGVVGLLCLKQKSYWTATICFIVLIINLIVGVY